jgi:genome maintenance exonuclease 1
MHEYLDCYVTNKKIDDSDSENSKIAIKLSEVIINNIFPKVDSFISTEATVHNNHEYAGTLDLLALIDGKLTIIDYKSSYRQKSVDQIDEHFQQLAAYALAHDNMHSTKIEQAMIFVAYKESYKNDIYTADLSLLNHYKLMWNEALNYYKEISL